MMTEQQQVSADRPMPTQPTKGPTRRDDRRARQMARTLELEDLQAVFLATPPHVYKDPFGDTFYQVTFLILTFVCLLGGLLLPVEIIGLGWKLLLIFVFPVPLFFIGTWLTSSLPRPGSLRSGSLHREQIHLYANGFVAIDARGDLQGARWDQLRDFRRNTHAEDQSSGRRESIRATIANPRPEQRQTLNMQPQQPKSTEICSRLEKAYKDFWMPHFWERLKAGETLDFDVLLLQRDWLGKTTPDSSRSSAALPRSFIPPDTPTTMAPDLADSLRTPTDTDPPVEWLPRSAIQSIRVYNHSIHVRTIEPVRRDKRGRADRLWLRLDTVGLKDAAILKGILPEIMSLPKRV